MECVSKEVLPWRLVLKLFSNVVFVLVGKSLRMTSMVLN